MEILTLIWFFIGPAVGYAVAKRRSVSPVVGALLGFVCGPCFSPFLVPLILGFFTGTDVPRLPKNSAGRSYSVDELPALEANRPLPAQGTGRLISVRAEDEREANQ